MNSTEHLDQLLAAIEEFSGADKALAEASLRKWHAFAAGEAMQQHNDEKFKAQVHHEGAKLRLLMLAGIIRAKRQKEREHDDSVLASLERLADKGICP